jgi:uncharacterized protein (TIGR02646 family)
MRKFQRSEEPQVLAANWEKWGCEWEVRRSSDSKARFYWHRINGEPVNQLIMPALKEQTQDHCSFCDNFPISPPGIDTIEHFKPKAKYPRLAYKWDNLYYCCPYCQQKWAEFDELALRPDADDYEFDRYFRWDFTKGTIAPNERASPEDQARAVATINLYRLNEGHPIWRKRAFSLRITFGDSDSDIFPYRNYVVFNLKGPLKKDQAAPFS